MSDEGILERPPQDVTLEVLRRLQQVKLSGSAGESRYFITQASRKDPEMVEDAINWLWHEGAIAPQRNGSIFSITRAGFELMLVYAREQEARKRLLADEALF